MWPPSAYNHRKRWHAFAERWDCAIEEGYARIECALVEKGCNIFSDPEPPDPAETPEMSFSEAVHLLHMHQNRVHGIGKAPGLEARR